MSPVNAARLDGLAEKAIMVYAPDYKNVSPRKTQKLKIMIFG